MSSLAFISAGKGLRENWGRMSSQEPIIRKTCQCTNTKKKVHGKNKNLNDEAHMMHMLSF